MSRNLQSTAVSLLYALLTSVFVTISSSICGAILTMINLGFFGFITALIDGKGLGIAFGGLIGITLVSSVAVIPLFALYVLAPHFIGTLTIIFSQNFKKQWIHSLSVFQFYMTGALYGLLIFGIAFVSMLNFESKDMPKIFEFWAVLLPAAILSGFICFRLIKKWTAP